MRWPLRRQNKVPKYIPMPKACSVIGAPMTYGQPYFGLDHGPDALREHELHEVRLRWRRKGGAYVCVSVCVCVCAHVRVCV